MKNSRKPRPAQFRLDGTSENSSGWVLVGIDFDNTGDWNVHLSNMYSHAGNRIVPLALSLNEETRRRVAVIGQGNQIYTRAGSTGRWSERGQAMRIHDSGWAWGSVFFDLENDGDKDLFVTNGYTSNSDPDAPDW